MKSQSNSGKVWARRGQYENALTKSRISKRPLQLSYVDLDLGEGESSRIYFRDIPAIIGLKLRDNSVPVEEKIPLMFDMLSSMIVNPATGEPIMTREDWEMEGMEFINLVSGAVLGIQVTAASEGDSSDQSQNQNQEGDSRSESESEEAQADPNPSSGMDG